MEENREGFGEDSDIEGLAAALGDIEESDAQKDIQPVHPAETPVFSDEPAIPAETPVFSNEPSAPYEPAGSALSDGASADSFSESAGGDDTGSRPSETPGVSKDQEGGDIDALIKKYEEIPSGKKEIVKTKKPGGGKALPVVPIAAAVGAIVIIALLKFVVFKPATAVQKVQPKQAQAKAAQAASPAGAPAVSASAVDYPGGAVLMGETEDGIEIKIIETDAAARDIKLFYQKNMADKGFEISASRKNRRTFNMKFFKGQEDYSVSVVPHEEKNLIIVTRAK